MDPKCKDSLPEPYITVPLCSVNPAYDCGGDAKMPANQFPSTSNSESVITTNLLNQAPADSLVKNYFYHEGETPNFTPELVFEGLSMVNELLPRVEEEDEDELDEEEDVITAKDTNGIGYTEGEKDDCEKLIELEDAKCVVNVESFECPICLGEFQTGQGVVLRECRHTFCR